jgi:hypothetical protein
MRDTNALITSKVTRTSIFAGLVALGAGMFVAAAALVVAPQHAAALPAYAQKEAKPCGYCHANPAGGGALTDKGKEYQSNGHKFKN